MSDVKDAVIEALHSIHPASGWHWAELDRANGLVRPRDGNSNALAEAIFDHPAMADIARKVVLAEAVEALMRRPDGGIDWTIGLVSVWAGVNIEEDPIDGTGPTLQAAIEAAKQ